MPGKIHRISTYHFRNTDHLLFDTNIWLFLYGSQHGPSDPRVRVYSAALKSVLAAQSRILIDVLILSELMNAMARFAFNRLPNQPQPRDFKAYRKSTAFKPIAKSITDVCRRILSQAIRTNSDFPSLHIETVLSDYEVGKADFNDQMLAELCKSNGLILVTDDGDFKGMDLTILTENKRLLP
ncbi:MAG: PIN domain-containing protein [Nitrospira sp. CG24B]|nr:MAG: PIN domain-containing protein [Nitrospira sp. CG24B]